MELFLILILCTALYFIMKLIVQPKVKTEQEILIDEQKAIIDTLLDIKIRLLEVYTVREEREYEVVSIASCIEDVKRRSKLTNNRYINIMGLLHKTNMSNTITVSDFLRLIDNLIHKSHKTIVEINLNLN